MKQNKHFLLATISLWLLSITTHAQVSAATDAALAPIEVKTIEGATNERFGTLLETLMADGKLSESGARAYLEAVFEYDEKAISYLNSISIQPYLDQIKSNTFSTAAINSKLLEAVPLTLKQQLNKNPTYIGWKLGRELDGGSLSAASVFNVAFIVFDAIKDAKRQKMIIEKLKVITPTTARLKQLPIETPKQTVINDSKHTGNWKINPEKIKKGMFSLDATYNKVTFQDGYLAFDPNDGYADSFQNSYQNKERFDFSKDFRITIKGKLDPYTYDKVEYLASNFSIKIGDMYIFDAYLMHAFKFDKLENWSSINAKSPAITFTPRFGIYNYENLLFMTGKPNTTTTVNIMTSGYKKIATENPSFNFTDGKFEVVIENIAGIMSMKINGIDTGVKQQVVYMPNRYSFDIKAAINRITFIESMKLEHL